VTVKLRPPVLALILAAVWVGLYLSLESLATALMSLMPLPATGHLTEAFRFFIYEVPKVLLLLVIVVFVVGIIRTYFSPERTRRMLAGKSLFLGNVLASGLGVVTPFCSCSAVPLFIGFVETGIPLGVTFSFLVAAPMINEVALVLLWGLFGWKTAVLYTSTGLVIAIVSGYIIGKLKVERFIEDWVLSFHANGRPEEQEALGWNERVEHGFAAVFEIVGKVWPYVLAGIAVGAGVHGYVPEDFLAGFMGRSSWWAVPLSVLIGIPLYSNAAGIIPIVHALLEKGAALGTTLAFMMAVIGLSLPETIILRKVIKLPLIAIFVGVVGAGILVVGYLFNFVYG
jgi:uncharacterized membrane protein YraQ (UPF0718 family)